MVEDRQDLGLAVLTSSAVFGAWSAWNSSLFTAATFVDTQEKYKNAKLAMDLGLATALAASLGIYLVYGNKGKIAAVSAIATGVVLYLAYYFKLRCNPAISQYMMGNKDNSTKDNKNTNQIMKLSDWKPLTNDEINNMRNLINKSSITIVSEQ